jgi:hypothetical protein
VNGIVTKKNSSTVTPAQISSDNAITTSAPPNSLFGFFPGREPFVKHQAVNVTQKTSTTSQNIAKINTGDAEFVAWRKDSGMGM